MPLSVSVVFTIDEVDNLEVDVVLVEEGIIVELVCGHESLFILLNALSRRDRC